MLTDEVNSNNVISIHALLAESHFSSPNTDIIILDISIHALLAESDPRSWPLPPKTRYFYPRSPCGERHHRHGFQKQVFSISIHALLAESD